MRLTYDLQSAIFATGFRYDGRDRYLRGPNAGGIEHVIFLARGHGASRGWVMASVAVRHQAVEATLVRLFRAIGLASLARELARLGGGYSLGYSLGRARPQDLTWNFPLRRPDGSTTSVATAVERMLLLSRLFDLYRVYKEPHSWQGWLVGSTQDLFRHLITIETLLRHGEIAEQTTELDTLARNFAAQDDPTYSAALSSVSFEQLRALARQSLT